MIKKLLVVLFMMPVLVSAKEINNVWITNTGSTLDVMCRGVWSRYDELFHTETIITPKPGLEGVIAVNDMVTSPAKNKFMCGGSGLLVILPLTQLPSDNKVNQIEPLIESTVGPQVWYVPNANKSKNFKELIDSLRALNRPINVGIAFASQNGYIHYLETMYNIKVNTVRFKSPAQMFPSLSDGQLDLAFDAGAGVNIAETGKFRVVGYFFTPTNTYDRLKSYPNFRADSPEMAALQSWIGIMVPKGNTLEDNQRVARRIQFIVQEDRFKKIAQDTFAHATGIIQPELGRQVERQIQAAKRSWK